MVAPAVKIGGMLVVATASGFFAGYFLLVRRSVLALGLAVLLGSIVTGYVFSSVPALQPLWNAFGEAVLEPLVKLLFPVGDEV